MSFDSWCLCGAFDLQQRLHAQRQAFLRRQFAAEARAFRAATITRYAYVLTDLDRDILAGLVDI